MIVGNEVRGVRVGDEGEYVKVGDMDGKYIGMVVVGTKLGATVGVLDGVNNVTEN